MLLFVIASSIYADAGGCSIYYAKFYLKDGSIFNGCFYSQGYAASAYESEEYSGKSNFSSDAGVLDAFKDVQKWSRLDFVSVYKEIFYVQPKLKFRKDMEEEHPIYAITISEDTKYIKTKNIQQLIFWKVESCKKEEESWVTTGQNGMIDTLDNETYWNELFFAPFYLPDSLGTHGFCEGFLLLNYSERNNIDELKRIAKLKFQYSDYPSFEAYFCRKYGLPAESLRGNVEMHSKCRKEFIDRRNQRNKWLWERGIFSVYIVGIC